MKTVVITGSTRGIGLGLARSFLDLGCGVMVNGRSQSAVDAAIQPLVAQYGADRVQGCACDVSDYAQVQTLWDAAKAGFGHVDIWINNAGIGQGNRQFIDLDATAIKAMVDINLMGVLYGSHVALRGMLAQGFGQIYNMEGAGSNGSQRDGQGMYGTTKRALTHFTKSLELEVKGKPIQVGLLSPGIVPTDLLLGSYREHPERYEQAKRIFNILADRAETVTPFLASHVLANTQNGAHIEWLTRTKIWWRFLSAPFHKRHIIPDEPIG